MKPRTFVLWLTLSFAGALNAGTSEAVPDPAPGGASNNTDLYIAKTHWLLRRDEDDLQSDVAGRKGMLFSWNSDLDAHDEQWLARGAIEWGRDWKINGNYAGAEMRHMEIGSIFLQAVFDRVSGTGGPEDETDVLQFSAGGRVQLSLSPLRPMPPGKPMHGPHESLSDALQAGTADRGPLFSDIVIEGKITDSTSFDFDRHVLGGQLNVDLVAPRLGLHAWTNQNAALPFFYLLNASLHAEGGEVVSGDRTPNDHTFLRVGPKFELKIFPSKKDDTGHTTQNDRLLFYGSWSGYEDISGHDGSTSLLKAGAKIKLVKGDENTPDVGLSIEYRNGELPFTGLRDESVIVGLSIGF